MTARLTFSRWSIARRLALAFVGVLLPYLLLGAIGATQLRTIWNHVLRIEEIVEVDLRLLDTAQNALWKLGNAVLEHALVGSDATAAAREQWLGDFERALGALEHLPAHDPARDGLLASLRAQAAEIAATLRADGPGAWGADDERLDALWVRALGILDQLEELALRATGQRVETLRADVARAVAAGGIALALSVGGGLVLAHLFASWIRRPLGDIARASRVMEGGDLSARASVTAGGELGEVGRAFDSMAARLQALHEAEHRRVVQLEEALRRVDELEGLLPMCAWCKRVRSDADYWEQIDAYLTARSRTRFTHGICPDCRSRQFDAAIERVPQADPRSETVPRT